MTLRYKKLAGIGLALASALTLAGCYDDGYGYSGVSVGYGSGGYYGYPGYYDYPGYYGWYDGFYYPGSGYYIYDRSGHRRHWDDNHRRHWEGQREAWRSHQGGTAGGGGNWQGRPRDGNWRDRAAQQGDGRRGEGRSWSGGDGRSWRGGQGAQAAPSSPRSDSGGRGWRGRGMREREQ